MVTPIAQMTKQAKADDTVATTLSLHRGVPAPGGTDSWHQEAAVVGAEFTRRPGSPDTLLGPQAGRAIHRGSHGHVSPFLRPPLQVTPASLPGPPTLCPTSAAHYVSSHTPQILEPLKFTAETTPLTALLAVLGPGSPGRLRKTSLLWAKL